MAVGARSRGVDARVGLLAVACTVPCPGGVNGSLIGGGGCGSRLAGSGFMPLLTDGAGITWPGFTGWSQRAAGAGQLQDLVRVAVPGVGAQRLVRLVAAALLRRRRALARDVDTRVVAGTAHRVALELLRDLAVQAFPTAAASDVGRGTPLARTAGSRSGTAAVG